VAVRGVLRWRRSCGVRGCQSLVRGEELEGKEGEASSDSGRSFGKYLSKEEQEAFHETKHFYKRSRA